MAGRCAALPGELPTTWTVESAYSMLQKAKLSDVGNALPRSVREKLQRAVQRVSAGLIKIPLAQCARFLFSGTRRVQRTLLLPDLPAQPGYGPRLDNLCCLSCWISVLICTLSCNERSRCLHPGFYVRMPFTQYWALVDAVLGCSI